MMTAKLASVAAALTGLLLAATPASANHHCVRAGGTATAITKETATMLAKESLYQSNLWSGRKARGAINVKCASDGVFTTCRARQVACK